MYFRTTKRQNTFYDGQEGSPQGMCFLPMSEPFCKYTREIVQQTAVEMGLRIHPKGTVLTVEGPRFSTVAESKMWRQFGAHCINMTSVPEV